MTWNLAAPADSDNASAGPAELRTMKTDVATALNVEHTFPGTPATPTAYHKIPYGTTATRPAAGHANRWYYNTTTGTIQRDTGSAWEDISSRVSIIPAGTLMPFGQAAAPSGWTNNASNDDSLLRVVSSAGGGTGGSWTATMDSKSHGHPFVSSTVSALSHTYANNRVFGTKSSNNDNIYLTINDHGDITHAHADATDDSHTHSTDGAWRPRYFDVLVCSKD